MDAKTLLLGGLGAWWLVIVVVYTAINMLVTAGTGQDGREGQDGRDAARADLNA